MKIYEEGLKMAKKLKFPLVLKDDYQVRTLEELREHFDLEKVLNYYQNGKLLIWLSDRFYNSEMIEIQELDSKSPDFISKLCVILGVQSMITQYVDLEALAKKNQQREKVKQYTSDEMILSHAEWVAFDQEELADLLDDGCQCIYLINNSFQIPMSKSNMTYINVYQAKIKNFESVQSVCKEKNICFVNFAKSKKHYPNVVVQIQERQKKDDDINIDLNRINEPQMTANPCKYYDTVINGGSSERNGIEEGKRCTLDAYIGWMNYFASSGYSNLYSSFFQTYLEAERQRLLEIFTNLAEQLYNDLEKILKNIDDADTLNECILVIKPLKKLGDELTKISDTNNKLREQMMGEMEKVYNQYQIDNYGCENYIRVEKKLCYTSRSHQSKERYVITANTGINKLSKYTNEKINMLSIAIQQIIAHNDTNETTLNSLRYGYL